MDYAEDTQKEESKQIKMEKYNWEIVEISTQIGILNVSADISAFFFILSLYSLSLSLSLSTCIRFGSWQMLQFVSLYAELEKTFYQPRPAPAPLYAKRERRKKANMAATETNEVIETSL